MKNLMKRSLALLMALLMIISLMPKLSLTAAAATTVDYQYGEGDYATVVKNWGARGELATFLSPMAEEFYANNSYETLSAYDGTSNLDQVSTSNLYLALNELMTAYHSTKNSYDEAKTLFLYTDVQKNGTNIDSFYSGVSMGTVWADGWSREHVWPDSLGGSSDTSSGTRTNESDIMMLRPIPTSENSSRGNKPYGNTTTTVYYFPNQGSYDVRGDVARTILYVYVRWGTEQEAVLQNVWNVIESKDVLLDWIEADPVDTWEMGRNDSVQSITGTRNVFIDYPELAFDLFDEVVPEMDTPSGIAGTSEYTITAVSNNEAYGTVSLSGRIITATPKTGYQVKSYEVTAGEATIVPNGNQYTVTPASDCTVQINFAEVSGYTVKLVANGITVKEYNVTDDYLTMPEFSGILPEGYTFCGWVTSEVTEATSTKPATVWQPGSTPMIEDDCEFYALVSFLNEEDDSNPQVVYQLVDSEDDLVIDSSYIIAAAESDVALSTTQNNNNRGQATVTKDGTTLNFESTAGVAELVLGEGVVPETTEAEVTEPETTIPEGSYIVTTYELVTDASTLAEGDKVIIAASTYDYALSTTQNGNNRGQAAIVKGDGTLTSVGSDVQIATLENGTADGTFAFNVGTGYLYAASTSKNYLRTETTKSANSSWTISIADGVATVLAQGTNTINYMQYNSSSKLFSCYASTSTTQKPIALYKVVETIVEGEPEVEETTEATEPTEPAKVYSFYDAANNGYLYAASSSSNHLKTQETLNENGSFVITVNTNGSCTLVAQGENTRNNLQYNSGDGIFSCYATTQKAVSLYVGVPGTGSINYTTRTEQEWETEIDTTDPTTPSEDVDPDPSEPAEAFATKITSETDFVSGKYVMVVNGGYALGYYGVPSGTTAYWGVSVQPVIDGDNITDAAGGVWTLTVTGSTVTIKDSNGAFIAPKAANTNGITSTEYAWTWAFADGTFTFAGDQVKLACNTGSSGNNNFRAYKDTTIAGSTDYLPNFTLYKVNETEAPTPDTTACPHTNTATTTVAATCTVAGSETVTCDDCGATVSTTEIAAGHSFTDGVCSVCQLAEAPQVGVEYNLVVQQNNLGKTLYATGAINTKYLATSDNVTLAARVQLEAVADTEGAYYLYFMDGETKTYIYITDAGAAAIGTEAPTSFTLDATYKTLFHAGTSNTYYLGCYGTYNTISASKTSYLSATSVDVSQFPARLHVAPEVVATAADGATKLLNENTYFTNGAELPATITIEDAVMDVAWTVTPTVEGAAAITDGALILTSQTASADYTLVATVSYNGETATATWNGKVLPSTVASVADGDYVIYFNTGDAVKAWTVISGNYGYIQPTDVTITDGVVSGYTNDNLFVLTANGDGTYTIVDNSGRYVYMTGNYDSFNVSTTKPETGADWYLYDNGDGSYFITNAMNGKTASYDADHTSFGGYADSSRWTTLSLITAERVEDALIIADGTYLIHLSDGTAVTPLDEAKTYGYLNETALTVADDGTLSGYMNKHIFTFTKNADADTYTIVDNYGRYVYMTGTYNNFNVSTEKPASGADWKLVDAGDGAIYIKNTNTQKTLANGISYNSFGAYADVSDTAAYDALMHLTAAEICEHPNEDEYTVPPTLAEDGYIQYVCADCGEKLYTEYDSPSLGYVDSWSLTLSDYINVNFRLAVANSIMGTAQVSFTIGSNDPIVYNICDVGFCENTGDDSVEYWLVSVPVAASQMQDEIKVQVLNGDDATEVKSYTVESYAKTVLADETMSQYHQVVKDMLNYGAAAQVYFNHNYTSDDKLPNADITGFGTAEIPENVVTEQIAEGTVDGISFYAASLVHKEGIAVRLYFKLLSGSIEDYSFRTSLSIDEADLETNTVTPICKDAESGLYYVEFADICPSDLDNPVTIYVIKDSQTISVLYSPLDYMIRMNNKDTSSDALKALLKALYNYHLAAEVINPDF